MRGFDVGRRSRGDDRGPAAIYQIALLAEKVASFPLGQNDLAQFLLATDRMILQEPRVLTCASGNGCQASIGSLKRPHQAGKPVSVCGRSPENPQRHWCLLGWVSMRSQMGSCGVTRGQGGDPSRRTASLRKFADEARGANQDDVERMLSRVVRTGDVVGTSSETGG